MQNRTIFTTNLAPFGRFLIDRKHKMSFESFTGRPPTAKFELMEETFDMAVYFKASAIRNY